MQSKSIQSGRCAQNGFSILEVMVAIAIMSVGLFGMAKLFIATALVNSFSTNTSQYLTTTEQTIESFKVTAATATSQAAVDNVVKSSVTEPATDAAVTATTAVYVLDNSGNLFPSGTTVTLPSDLAAVYGPNKTCAPSARSRLVIVRLTPKYADNRLNQVVTLVSTVEMKDSY